MIAALVTVVLAMAAVAYVATPLRRGAPGVAVLEDDRVDVLRERQEAAVEALRELDYEQQIGKLSDTEYFSLRDVYARRAMALLKAIDDREAARDRALELAVARRRARTDQPHGGAQGAAAAARAASHAGGRSALPWLLGTAGGALSLVVAIALLVTTIRAGASRPAVIGTLPLQSPAGLTFLPGAANTLLAAGNQRLLHSSDGGASWQPVTASLPEGQVLGLFPAPDGSGVESVVRGSGGPPTLWRSVDGGATWTAGTGGRPLPAGTRDLVAVPGQPPLLFVATDSGVEASGDQGGSWSAANGFVNGLLPDGPVAGLAYAATGDTAVDPRGQTWHGLLYAATGRGLYKSSDGGMSWFALPLGGDLVAVAVDPASPGTVVVLDAGGRLYRSHDGGAHWNG